METNIEQYIEERTDVPPYLQESLFRGWRQIAELIDKNRFSNLLEIGTYKGATTLRFANLVNQWGGSIETININPQELEVAEAICRENGLTNVTFHLGDSLEILEKLHGPWDLVLIDGLHSHARSMADYLAVKDKMKKNAVIIFDDVAYSDSEDGGVPKTAAMLGLSAVPVPIYWRGKNWDCNMAIQFIGDVKR